MFTQIDMRYTSPFYRFRFPQSAKSFILYAILYASALLFYPLTLFAQQAFSPLHYTPTIDPIIIDANKCELQFFVSPYGNDAWTGKKSIYNGKDGPFATISKAKNTIRNLIQLHQYPKNGVAVNIIGGDYSLEKSIVFEEADSGFNNAPIIYRAWKNQLVRFLGGKKIDISHFAPVTDSSIIQRLSPSAVGKVVQLDTRQLGITHNQLFPDVFNDNGNLFELFVNNERMPLSRWPDSGYTTMKEVVVPGDKNTPGSFIYRNKDINRWIKNDKIWLKGFWRVGWEEPAIKVAHIDTLKQQIDFTKGIPLGIGNSYYLPKGSGKEQWFAINLLEEITRPGEWCIDFASGILYFWPPSNFVDNHVIISQLDKPLFVAKNLRNTAFIGLHFEASLAEGMLFTNSYRNLIAGCTFQNLGSNALVLSGEQNGIQSCDMFNIGKGCIVVSGGNRKQLKESGNYVINNHLHHYGILKSQYSAAIDTYSENNGADAVGMLIAHNQIHHAPRDGILFGGNKIVFEYNEIYYCGYATADVGAFYSWMDWTIRGIIIRYNYIHNTVGGVNPDDGASGTFVYGNIFAGNRTGVWIASGPDHTIKNNIFIKNQGPVFCIDDRGKARDYANNSRLIKKVLSINPTQPPWSIEFPEMSNLLSSNPELPLRTKFEGNLIYIKKGIAIGNKMHKEYINDTTLLTTYNNYTTTSDPGFVNLPKGNLQLKINAPVFKIIPQFPNIPFNKMGLQLDKYRKKMPTEAELGKLPAANPWKDEDTNLNFGT